jgi:hypothetical protein
VGTRKSLNPASGLLQKGTATRHTGSGRAHNVLNVINQQERKRLHTWRRRFRARLVIRPARHHQRAHIGCDHDHVVTPRNDKGGFPRKNSSTLNVLINLVQDQIDRRHYRLHLTDTGRELAQSVSRWTAPTESTTAEIPRSDGEQLLATLLDVGHVRRSGV